MAARVDDKRIDALTGAILKARMNFNASDGLLHLYFHSMKPERYGLKRSKSAKA